MSEPSNDSLTMSRALVILRGHTRLATMVFLGVLVGATTVAMSLPDIYRATATTLVDYPGTGDGVGRAPAAVDLETRLQTIQQEVLSQTRLLTFMDRLDLYPMLRARGDGASAVDRLRRDVQVKLIRPEGRRTVAFSITVRWPDSETAARVANALAAIYIEENAKIRERQGSAARLTRLGQELAQMQEVYTARYPDVIRLKAEIAALGRDGSTPSLAVGEEFRALDPALPPRGPAAPQRGQLILMSIGLAVGAAVMAVALVEWLGPSFRGADEFRASMPSVPSNIGSRQLWPTAARVAVGLALVVFASYHLARGNDQLVGLLSRAAVP